MLSQKVSIPLIIIVVAAAILFVSIKLSFKTAEANQDQNTFTQSEPTQEESVQEPTKPAVEPEVIQSIENLDLPSVKPMEEPSDLARINQLLQEKINISLLHPGWVHFSTEHTSFIEGQDSITVPENDQVIPKNYILNQYMLVADDLTINVHFIHGISQSGQEYTATLQSKDERWFTANTTSLQSINLPHVLGTKNLDDLIIMGFAGDTKIKYQSEEDTRVLRITIITQFPRPVGFNGWEDARVVEYAQTYFYNWETGLPLRVEEMITREDGTQMLAGLSTYTVSQLNELPNDVMNRMSQMGD